MVEFNLKDSGKREHFEGGMQRDTQEGKPRFDLLCALDQKYNESLLYAWAMVLAKGAEKYNERNWEKGNSLVEFNRYKASAWRHFVALMNNEVDENHFGAVCFNLNGMLRLMNKLQIDVNGNNVKGGEKDDTKKST